MYKFKQDLASAYFPDNSKKTASKRFAHEIHSNKPLMAALQATGYSRPRKSSPKNNSKSSSPSSVNLNKYPPPNTTKGETSGLALIYHLLSHHHQDINHHYLQYPHYLTLQHYHFHYQNENKFCQFLFYLYFCKK